MSSFFAQRFTQSFPRRVHFQSLGECIAVSSEYSPCEEVKLLCHSLHNTHVLPTKEGYRDSSHLQREKAVASKHTYKQPLC